jgi:hypothetical protein
MDIMITHVITNDTAAVPMVYYLNTTSQEVIVINDFYKNYLN